MQCEHSVEAGVSAEFAWNYWTNVANWSDPPARFELLEPFSPGARGTTYIPGQEPVVWTIAAVDPGRSGTIEMTLDRAVMAFQWSFDAGSPGRTRLTQEVRLTGENAEAYAGAFAMFQTNLPLAMSKMAAAMEQAAR